MRALGLAVFFICIPTLVFAGGDVYLGGYLAPRHNGDASGSREARYVAGLSFDKTFYDRMSLFVKWETQMDSANADGSFRPVSIKYDVGADVKIYDGAYIGASRMCWHPVNKGGVASSHWLIRAGFRW